MFPLAGKLAGLEVLRLLPEPSAAALAYGHERTDLLQGATTTVLIYDLGGGTFDVTLAVIQGTEVTVRVIEGDNHLGGHDFDVCVMKWVAEVGFSVQCTFLRPCTYALSLKTH